MGEGAGVTDKNAHCVCMECNHSWGTTVLMGLADPKDLRCPECGQDDVIVGYPTKAIPIGEWGWHD